MTASLYICLNLAFYLLEKNSQKTFTEFRSTIVFADFDLESVVVTDEGAKSSQTLTTTSTNADQ
jgi:hypothetical protein